MLDAQVTEGAAEALESSAQFKMPVTEALATTGVIVPLGDIADPGIGARNLKEQGIQRRFVAVGEQIYAVQYRGCISILDMSQSESE
jgi:hypothetical protein